MNRTRTIDDGTYKTVNRRNRLVKFIVVGPNEEWGPMGIMEQIREVMNDKWNCIRMRTDGKRIHINEKTLGYPFTVKTRVPFDFIIELGSAIR